MVVTEEKAAEVATIMARFDQVIESSKVGVRKPDPRIYAMMCEALSVQPENCVYLDDLGINCKPAAAMGMAAIKRDKRKPSIGSAWRIARDGTLNEKVKVLDYSTCHTMWASRIALQASRLVLIEE